MNKDLTTGNTPSVLFKFCLPLFGSIVFQQLYNIADSFVAGKFINDSALAAVGNSYEITLIYIAFAFGCNIGCSVIISQLFGAKKMKDLKTAVSTTFIFSSILCVVLMATGFIFSPSLLKAMNTPENVLPDSLLYLNIYTGGLLFLFIYNIATGIFSAMGDSKTPFYFLAVSSIANIFADIFSVTVLHMGVDGVAWATFICQGISGIAAVITLFRRLSRIETDEKPPLFSFRLLKRILIVTIPSILQQSFISVGNILIQSIVNSFGESVMAGYSAAVKLNGFAVTALVTLGNGISNFTAQNIGAEKHDRVRQGYISGLAFGCLIAIPATLLFFFQSDFMIGLFTKDTAVEVIKHGDLFLRIVSPFYIVVSAKIVSDGVLRGAGKMTPFVIATFTDLILRVVLAYLFSLKLNMGPAGIWYSWPCGWVIATILSVIFCTGIFSKKNFKKSI